MPPSSFRSAPPTTRTGRAARAVLARAKRAWAAWIRLLRFVGHAIASAGSFVLGWLPLRPSDPKRRHRGAEPGSEHATRQEARLVHDCEAFFVGQYQTRLPRRFRWQWAWVNTLAHGERADIEALASKRPGKHNGAAVFAAGEVLRAHERHGWELGWFQRRYLVPLELDCMRGRVRGPVATVGGVLDALRRARPDSKPARPADRSPGRASAGGAVS